MTSEKPHASWLPLPHFMALAPLDVWARLLFRKLTFPAPRYLARIVLGVTTSVFGTAVTLPERIILAPYLWLRFGKNRATLHHKPGVVVIAGYYRSGTTHLHYLLSCDPQMKTPRWAHVSTPQGWFVSWFLVRIFMIPFVSNSRPQDDVAFGPEWPSEDDFASNNWSLTSSLPGRFIVPSQYEHYERFHSLDRLTDRERQRWRRTLASFCWKLLAFSPNKKLLLKTPSHTARLSELRELFGDGLRVIHISRDPDAVVRSNVRMAERLEPYSLEPMPDSATVRERVVREFVETEDRFCAQAEGLGPGHVAMLRFEDLIADPLGQLHRCYDELGIEWTEGAEVRFRRYLGEVRDYKPRHGGEAKKPELEPELAQLAERFGHDQPGIEPKPIEHEPVQPIRDRRAAILTWLAALVLGLGWIGWAALMHDRTDPLMWIFGIVLGLVAVRTAGRGSPKLGLITVAAFVVLIAASVWPVTYFAYGHQWDEQSWARAWTAVRTSMTASNNLLLIVFGLVSAYRVATRIHVRPPGT
jgi:omega-hydroxy-beta-dihydromenaquinone-9 sulfotransferase